MIIDSSSVLAILRREPGWETLEDVMIDADTLKIGAPTRMESGMVLIGRLGIRGRTLLERFLQDRSVQTVTYTAEHASIALDAFHQFGKGRHPAGLNMGDCHTYAVAALAREPLLCVGKDFPQTDLELVDVGE